MPYLILEYRRRRQEAGTERREKPPQRIYPSGFRTWGCTLLYSSGYRLSNVWIGFTWLPTFFSWLQETKRRLRCRYLASWNSYSNNNNNNNGKGEQRFLGFELLPYLFIFIATGFPSFKLSWTLFSRCVEGMVCLMQKSPLRLFSWDIKDPPSKGLSGRGFLPSGFIFSFLSTLSLQCSYSICQSTLHTRNPVLLLLMNTQRRTQWYRAL